MDSQRVEMPTMKADYSDWVFIDKKDLSEASEDMTVDDWTKAFPGCGVKGTRQPFHGDWATVENISVCYSKVSPTILDRCPSLRWVLVRGHSVNCVDLISCRKRNVGVVSAGAFTRNCAKFIQMHLGTPPYVFYGFGRIAKAVVALLGDGVDIRAICSRTPQLEIDGHLKDAGTLIATVPIPLGFAPPLFSIRLFRKCSGVRFVSICHEPLMENRSLKMALEEGCVESAVVDCLQEEGKGDLLGTKGMMWTEDSAWKVEFSQMEYQDIIRKTIDDIRFGKLPDGLIVRRRS